MLGSVLGVVPVGLPLAGGVEAQYRESSRSAFLHRTEIVEGQTRTFEISGVGADTYYLHVEPLNAPYTAEAGDFAVTILDGTDAGAPLAVGGFGAVQRDLQLRIRFDVAALAPAGDDEGDETFGVQLCTTADCTGGTILGDWTVTMTDAPADTAVSGGSGVTVTIPGASGDGVVSVMEVSPNGDNRDQLGEFILTLAAAPSQDIVIVAKADTTASTNSSTGEMGPIARSNAASSLDYHSAESASYNPAEAYYEVARFGPGDTNLTRAVTVASVDNDEDTAALSVRGDLEFMVLQDDAAYRDGTVGNAAVYSGITIPNVPVELTGDDEHTVITLGDAATADNAATEASATDTAKFRVTVGRGLGAGETLTVPIAFAGATLGTHFTLALEGSPNGVVYADATDGSGRGMLTFTGPSDAEATLVVTAAGDDGDTVQNRLRLWVYKDDQTWRRTRFDTNMVGGVCAGDGCIGGFLRDRQHNITLNEAAPGIRVIDTSGGTITNRTNYEFQVRLNTQPSGDVVVTATAPTVPGASLQWTKGGDSRTFTMSDWDQPQTFTLWYSDQRDTPTASHSVTLAVTSASDSTYNGLSDVTHDLIFLDNFNTDVEMAGDGVRAGSSSGSQISSIMVEGDATRVDSTLTVSLGRALVDGEYLRVPLLLVAEGHDTSTDGDGCLDGDGNLSLDDCDVVETVRGPRYSANVSWPTHYNDFDMAATGTGVSIRAVNRRTPAHTGYRYLEFRGAGAQDATIRLNARDGFNDGEGFDERFYIIFNDVIQGANPAPVDTNLDGGVNLSNQRAWFQIADDDDFTGAGTVVPDSWSLLPASLESGDKFRLIYVTSGETAASSSDLSTYDTFVRAEITGNNLVNGGVTDLTAHATSFKAIGEAVGTSARDHASFNPGDAEDPNEPIYWVGGSKVADDKADFTDYSWDDEANPRYADGSLAMYDSNSDGTKDTAGPDPDGYWTGTDRTGAQSSGFGTCGVSGLGYPSNPRLGASRVSVGYLNEAGSRGGPNPQSYDANTLGPTTFSGAAAGQGYCHSFPNSETRPMYALSGVFTVVPADGVTLTGSSAAEGSAVTFTVTLPEAAPAGGITVPYTLSDGRGISSDPSYIVATSADYTDTAGSVTVPQGATTASFTVATTADSIYESDHYFTATLGTPTGTNAPPLHSRKSAAAGAITDDADAPTIAFSSATASVAEDAGTADVTVTKTGTTLVPASVYWTTADGTAAHPGDYTAQSGYLEFAPGEVSKTITVDLVDDATGESAETFMVQLDSAQVVDAQLGGTTETTVTVTDDDGTGPVSVTMSASDGDSDGNAVEGGAGTTGYRTVAIALGRALTASEEVTVPLSVAGATVTADYTFALHPLSQTGVTLTTTGGTHTAQDPAVVFSSGAQTATLRLTPVDNSVRTQPYVIVDYGTGGRVPSGSGGVTLDTPTGGPVGVVLVDDESGDIVLPAGAAFRPAVSADQEYRLLFMTSAGGPASSSDIADYDHFVRAAAVGNGGADLLRYAGFFRAFVSTAGTHGREHVGIWGSGAYADGTTRAADSGTGLYWLGTGGQSAALNHWRFCNEAWFGRWSATATRLRHEDGSVGDGARVWTGMNNDCSTSSSPLGTATPTYGPGAQAGSGSASQALSLGTEAAANENRFYAVSEVVKTVASADMPQVAFSQRAAGTNEGDAVRLTLTASPAPTADLTVTYDVAPSSPASATAGQDFTAGEASVTIPAGQTSVSFDVATLEDAVFEPGEAFRVILGASPDFLPGSIRSATVTINDDDRLKVGFAQDEYWVLEDSGSVDVDLTLSHHTAQAVSLVLSVGGTATNGSDYTAPAVSVTIPSGNTSGTHTVSIPIAADSAVEPDETIALAISSVSTSFAGKASRDRTTVFIADQDRTAPGLVVPSTVEVDEGRTAVYRLRLATAPTGTVTVTVTGHTAPELTLDADDEMANAQNSVQFDASNWYIGRKVTLGGVHDADLTDETVTLSHSASGAEYGSVTGSVAATVDDEDVTLSITGGAAVAEGTAAEFTVTASSAPERNLAVLVAIADASGADFVAAGQQGDKSRRLNAGQATATFTVPTVDDAAVEPSGPITIALRTSDNYRIDSSASSAEVQVNDDDGPVTVTMTASRTSAVEGANDSTGYSDITITLGRALTGSEIVRVPLGVVGATVGSSNDFTFGLEPGSQTGVSLRRSGQPGISAQNPVIVFSAGGRTATLRLTPVDNGVRSQPYAVVDFGTQDGGTRSSGSPTVTLGTPTGGPVGVVFVDDETGDIEVAADWALAPSGLSAGDEFRLLYITSQSRNAESTDIGDYNAFVRRVTAEGGHAELKPYAGLAAVVGSTAATDARENTAMWDPTANSNAGGHSDGSTSDTDSGVEIYWIAAPPTHKIADNYFDFYDGSWDTGADNRNEAANEAGTVLLNLRIWTGANNMGTSFSGFALGEATPRIGWVNSNNTTLLDDAGGTLKTNSNAFIAVSPVFTVAAAATGPVVSVRLMVGEGENRNSDGEVEKPESDATVSFPVSLDAQPAADMTVCVRVAESGDTDRVTMADEGIKTVSFLTGVQAGSIDVAWTDTADDDLDSVITVTAVPSSTAGCTSTDSYTVSGTHGSEKVRITDDEVTQLSLSSSDPEMGEGDASDTAVLTVSAGRALVAGESVVATITLASGTGARLPGHGTPDFAVTVTGTGVALTGAATATPRVTFTGADGSTVQTATVTLTPVAAADDGDTADEEVTATLSVVAGTGSGTVVTGGGVEVASASSEVDLSIDDDETSACAAQSTVFSVSDLRVTEMGGVATYCVRLLTAPSGGQTTVTIGEAAGQAVFDPSTFTVIESVSSGAATVSPSSLTFTASNYTEPREVTVTAVDEAGDNRNRRFNLTHTASGGGYSSQALGAVPVLVTDAPELEVFEYRRTYDEAAYNAHKRAHGGWGIFRPNTLTSTPGLGPAPDITPGEVLDYFVRLSSQPAGEVVVTINVTQIAGYDPTTFTGISFTRGGAPQQSLSFTFHDGDPTAAGCSDGGYGGDRYTQTRISWKCYRVVWVHNTRDGFGEEGTRCANVVHTAVGGGFRAATVDTIRAFSIGNVYGNSPKEYLIGQYRDQDTNAFYRLVYFSRKNQSVPYTWHMRPWSGGPLVTADTLNLEMEWVPSGKLHFPADCPLLRRQYANQHTPQNSPLPAEAPPVPETAVANLTLTAKGTSVDVAWDAVADATRYLVAYTAETTDGEAQSAGVFDGVTATGYTFDHGIAGPATVTVTVTPGHDTDGGTIAVYLEDLAATATVDSGTTAQTAVPEVSVTAGADVTEGSDATFTLTAAPAPAAPLTVAVDIAQTGDHAATTGTQTVTIGTSGSYTLTVATTDDDTDEADGTVTATVNDGAGYTVSTADTASVAVADDDPPPGCVPERTLKLARDYYELNRHRAPGYGKNWRRVLIAFGDITDTQLEAFTAAEARQSETRWAGWRPFREALECIEDARQDPAPPPDPEISITAGADITEGSDATFTITAAPAPAADLTVTIEITQTGDYATTGTHTVTIPTTGTYTLVVATTDDSTDEPDGSITATIDTGTGYTVSTTDSDATVNVADDDDPPPPPTPEISITAGNGITEGSDATFTVTASPTPHAALSINVSVSQSGDHGATTGTQTITIPTSGSYTLTVATTDDSTDEPDGTITATIDTGAGYTISTTNSDATVAVTDDDVPEVSITAGTDITEGTDATFTVTASPTPHAALDVTVTVSQSGDHGVTTGSRTITISTSGSATFTVATSDDSTDEPDGSVTATIDDGTGYSVSASDGAATVAVADNDDRPADDDSPDPVPSGPPTVSVADATATEGDPQGLRFVVEVTPAGDQTITLGYGVFDGTAAQGHDFNAPYRLFTLDPGEGRLEIVLPIIDDNETEGDETLTLFLFATSGITIPSYFLYATGTIEDND